MLLAFTLFTLTRSNTCQRYPSDQCFVGPFGSGYHTPEKPTFAAKHSSMAAGKGLAAPPFVAVTSVCILVLVLFSAVDVVGGSKAGLRRAADSERGSFESSPASSRSRRLIIGGAPVATGYYGFQASLQG